MKWLVRYNIIHSKDSNLQGWCTDRTKTVMIWGKITAQLICLHGCMLDLTNVKTQLLIYLCTFSSSLMGLSGPLCSAYIKLCAGPNVWSIAAGRYLSSSVRCCRQETQITPCRNSELTPVFCLTWEMAHRKGRSWGTDSLIPWQIRTRGEQLILDVYPPFLGSSVYRKSVFLFTCPLVLQQRGGS